MFWYTSGSNNFFPWTIKLGICAKFLYFDGFYQLADCYDPVYSFHFVCKKLHMLPFSNFKFCGIDLEFS